MIDDHQPTSGFLEDGVHVLPVRVYYEDTDFSGLVYHANYSRYFERGRSDFLRVAGVHHTELLSRADPVAFAVTRMEIDFKRGARIDDALSVRTRFSDLRDPRLFIAQHILREDEVICAAKVEVVCIDLAGRPRRVPKDIVEILRPFFGEAP